MIRINRIKKEQKGAVAVEFALILPILILLLFGIFSFGSAYNHYLSISHAAREGARSAAIGNFDEAAVRTEAFPADVTSVSVSYPNGNVHGEPVTVTVNADFELNIPFIPPQVLQLSSAASMRLEV